MKETVKTVKTVILMDLDGTLKTEADDIGPFEVPSMEIQSGMKKYIFAPRPFVKELMDEIKSKSIKLYKYQAYIISDKEVHPSYKQ
jgi:hypothetical protein